MIGASLGQLLLASLVAGLAAMERKAVLQAMFSRPIVVGPLVGAALGDVSAGLFVAAPLELLWAGAASLGAALPHHETAASAAIVGAAVAAGGGDGVQGAEACLAFACLAPLALLGRSLERIGERSNERLASRAEAALASGAIEAGLRLHLLGLLRPFVVTTAGTAAAIALGPVLAALLAALPPSLQRGLGLGWALVWAAGGAAAVRAARLPQGAALAVGAAVAAAGLWAASSVLEGRP